MSKLVRLATAFALVLGFAAFTGCDNRSPGEQMEDGARDVGEGTRRGADETGDTIRDTVNN